MIRVFRLLTYATVLLALIGGTVLASNEGKDLIKAAMLAPFEYSFRGTMLSITRSEGISVSTEITTLHGNPNRDRWEYLDPSGKPMLVVISDAGKQWEVLPRENTVYLSTDIECCSIDEIPGELARVYQNYEVVLNGSATVAGRETAIFTLLPLYSGNPVTVLWIDTETGVVLRWEKYSDNGDLMAMRVYTSFELVQELDSEMFRYIPQPGQEVIQTEHPALPEQVIDLQKQVGEVIRYPTGLPPGFRFTRGRVLSRFRPSDTVQLQFADGLNTISVFQTFFAQPHLLSQVGRLERATKLTMQNTEAVLVKTAEGYVLSWHKGNVTYSIVGDLPVDELKAMAHSFRD